MIRLAEDRQPSGLIEKAEGTGRITSFQPRPPQGSIVNPGASLVVTNVPGPPFPLYLLGARMLEAYPLVPLFMGQALGIALFSNAGKLFWGFNADWDALPDLHDVVAAVDVSFAELQQAQPKLRKPAARKKGGRALRAPRSVESAPGGSATLEHTA